MLAALPCVGQAPLRWEATDVNGLPLNVYWANAKTRIQQRCFKVTEREYGHRDLQVKDPTCADTVLQKLFVTNEIRDSKVLGMVCNLPEPSRTSLRGHLNLFPATFVGDIRGFDYQGGWLEDQDYNLFLKPLDRPDTIELEFDAREVIGRLPTKVQDTTHDWFALRRQVKDSFERARETGQPWMPALLRNSFAIATGLYSLDAVHDYHPELHPLWALAVQVADTGAGERWLMFVRNTGNEGECSHGQVPFDLSPDDSTARLSYSFMLPWQFTATGVTVRSDTFFATDPDVPPPDIAIDSGHGVRVHFSLPKAKDATVSTLVIGGLDLEFYGPPVYPVVVTVTGGPGESLIAGEIHKLGVSEQRSLYDSILAALSKERLTESDLDRSGWPVQRRWAAAEFPLVARITSAADSAPRGTLLVKTKVLPDPTEGAQLAEEVAYYQACKFLGRKLSPCGQVAAEPRGEAGVGYGVTGLGSLAGLLRWVPLSPSWGGLLVDAGFETNRLVRGHVSPQVRLKKGLLTIGGGRVYGSLSVGPIALYVERDRRPTGGIAFSPALGWGRVQVGASFHRFRARDGFVVPAVVFAF